MIYDPLHAGDAAPTHGYVWRLHHETGKQGSNQFRQMDYLPRLPVSKVLRIISDVRTDLGSYPKRERLIELLRDGIGVPVDTDGMKLTREISPKDDPERVRQYMLYLDYLQGYATKIAKYMQPWAYLPNAQWVQQAIGRELWPFFGRTIHEDDVVERRVFDVPDYAARGALIYKVTAENPEVYELIDAYVLKSKGGTVALPATFAMHTKSKSIETDDETSSGRKKKRTVVTQRCNIHRQISIAKTLKPGRQYVTLFGLFYFDPPTPSGGETLTQAQQLKQCFEIDVYTSNETVMFGYEGRPARVSAKIEALRPRFNAANDYLARTRHRFPDGKLPDNVQKACLKAQAVVEEMNSLYSKSADAESIADKQGSSASPITRLAFYALDVMQASTFRREENEWTPLPTQKFDVAADRIYGNDKSVKAVRKVTATTALDNGATKRFW